MAGMISFLRNNQLRIDSGSTTSCAEESISDFRKPPIRSPISGRRGNGTRYDKKTWTGISDGVPRRFRKKRCNEIHPLLRRSVCTLLLAGIGVMTGLTLLLLDHYMNNEISKAGIAVMSVSFFIFLIGMIWYCWSVTLLQKLKEKNSTMNLKRENRLEEAFSQEYHLHANCRACDPAAVSAAKWPAKKVMPEELSSSSFRKSDSFLNQKDEDRVL